MRGEGSSDFPAHWQRTLPTTTARDRSQCGELLREIRRSLAERPAEQVAYLHERLWRGQLVAVRLHLGTALPDDLPLLVDVLPAQGTVGETVTRFTYPLADDGEWERIVSALHELGQRCVDGDEASLQLGFTYRLDGDAESELARSALDSDPLEGPPWARVETLAERLAGTGLLDDRTARCVVATECYGYTAGEVAARLDAGAEVVEAARDRGLDRLRGSREVIEVLRDAGRADETLTPLYDFEPLGRFDEVGDFDYPDRGRHTPEESLCGEFLVSPDAERDVVLHVVDEVRDPADESIRAYVVYRSDGADDPEPLLCSPGHLADRRELGQVVEGTVRWAARPHYEELREIIAMRGPFSGEGDSTRDVEEVLATAREDLSEAAYRDLERRLEADEGIDVR